MNKTKIMMADRREEKKGEGKYPCAVCKKGVGGNSIQCQKCKKWVHSKCSGIKGNLKVMENQFICKKCDGSQSGQETEWWGQDNLHHNKDGKLEYKMSNGETLEMVTKFCYLGDVIEAGGGVESAVRARIQKAWGKFRELGSIITRKGMSIKVKGRVYDACVRSTLLYGSETWAVKVEQVQRMERTEMQMVRWMCGTKLADRIANDELRQRLGIESVKTEMKRRRLRWWGHTERRQESDWLKKCQNWEVKGKKLLGRPKKTWREVVKKDMEEWGLKPGMERDRNKWRRCLTGKRQRTLRGLQKAE
jgi:hypothetical protein